MYVCSKRSGCTSFGMSLDYTGTLNLTSADAVSNTLELRDMRKMLIMFGMGLRYSEFRNLHQVELRYHLKSPNDLNPSTHILQYHALAAFRI